MSRLIEEKTSISFQDSAIVGDVTITQNNAECPNCNSSNVRVMKCQQNNCDKKLCELCHPKCRYSNGHFFKFDSGEGLGPFCEECGTAKFTNWEEAERQERDKELEEQRERDRETREKRRREERDERKREEKEAQAVEAKIRFEQDEKDQQNLIELKTELKIEAILKKLLKYLLILMILAFMVMLGSPLDSQVERWVMNFFIGSFFIFSPSFALFFFNQPIDKKAEYRERLVRERQAIDSKIQSEFNEKDQQKPIELNVQLMKEEFYNKWVLYLTILGFLLWFPAQLLREIGFDNIVVNIFAAVGFLSWICSYPLYITIKILIDW